MKRSFIGQKPRGNHQQRDELETTQTCQPRPVHTLDWLLADATGTFEPVGIYNNGRRNFSRASGAA